MLSKQSHSGEIRKVLSGESEGYTILRDKVIGNAGPGSDAWAVGQKKISITPLLQNPRGNKLSHSLKCLAPAIFNELLNES
jgi:hypothetical protein